MFPNMIADVFKWVCKWFYVNEFEWMCDRMWLWILIEYESECFYLNLWVKMFFNVYECVCECLTLDLCVNVFEYVWMCERLYVRYSVCECVLMLFLRMCVSCMHVCECLDVWECEFMIYTSDGVNEWLFDVLVCESLSVWV